MSVSLRSLKIVALVAALACIPVLSFAGGQSDAQGANLILATGGTSGTYYPFGGAMAQIWNKNIAKMNVTAQATGASKENIRLVGKSEADLAIVQNDVMDYAFNGVELFNNEKVEGFRTLATLYPEIIQIVVDPASGINSIADMKGKRISVGDAGSGVEANAKQILEANGLSFSDLKAAHLSFKESAAGVKDKQLDGFFVTAGVPNAAIQELSALAPVKILSVDEATGKKLMDKYKFYTKESIPASTYNGMTAPASTVAVKATLIVRKGLSEKVVYDLTKALFEKQADLASAHAKGKELNLANAVQGVSIEFHPGALKYYKEKGVK
ncbi:MAG: TAXI family TRAP transporter solute-binding subunit [Treponemataceae bacterium]